MQYSCCKILIGYLILQVAVDATVSVFIPMYYPRGGTYDGRVAVFPNRDATIIDSSIAGQLEQAAPPDACSPMAHPFFVRTDVRRNLVLINGADNCHFMTKIKNARAAGFEAAILFDPSPEPFNYSDITFPIERSEINITVALVSFEDGIKLQKNYLFPDSRKANSFVEILPTSAYQIELYVIYGFLGLIGVAVLFVVVVFLVVVVQDKLQNYRNKVQGRVNVTNWNIPASESTHLLGRRTYLPESPFAV